MNKRKRKQDEAKYTAIIPTPTPVEAVFDNLDGSEYRETVLLIGLDTTGEVHFLTADPDGIFCDPSDEAGNFIRFEFR